MKTNKTHPCIWIFWTVIYIKSVYLTGLQNTAKREMKQEEQVNIKEGAICIFLYILPSSA